MRALEALYLIGVEGATEVWLVRHGDSYSDLTDVDDPPLSALGRDQARRLADRVRPLQPAAVYSSPYRRALQTAQTITDDVRIDERLVEMALEVGEDGSLNFQEDPLVAAERMRRVLDDVASEHAGKRVVLLSHGAAIVACLSDVLRLGPGQLRVLPYYTSVSTVRVLGDRRMVGTLCDTAHLER